MTLTMAKSLDLKYRVIDQVGKAELKSDPGFKVPDTSTGLEKLQKEYFDLFGVKPHHRIGEEKLKAAIAEEKAKQ